MANPHVLVTHDLIQASDIQMAGRDRSTDQLHSPFEKSGSLSGIATLFSKTLSLG
jgi:hypothetical protein